MLQKEDPVNSTESLTNKSSNTCVPGSILNDINTKPLLKIMPPLKINKVSVENINTDYKSSLNEEIYNKINKEVIPKIEYLLNQNNPSSNKEGFSLLKEYYNSGYKNSIIKILYALCLELSIGTENKEKESLIIYKEIIKESRITRIPVKALSLALIRMIIIRTTNEENFRINKPEADFYLKYLEKLESPLLWLQSLSTANIKLQYTLGVMYLYGIGVKRCFKTAFKYFYLSGKQGYSKALWGLGYCIYQKYVLPEKLKYSIDLFFLASLLGNKPALYFLGYIFEKEIYYSKNIRLSKKFYKLASKGNNLMAITQLGKYYEEIENNQKRGLILYLKAAKKGYPPAQYILSKFYEKKYKFLSNFWLKKAATQGLICAQREYALTLFKSQRNTRTALIWFFKTILNLNSEALFILARILRTNEYKGFHIPCRLKHQTETALLFYEIAAINNHRDSMVALSLCYRNNQTLKSDASKSFELMESAAKAGHSKAQYCLGIFYSEGFGVEKDFKKSIFWYAKAAQKNSAAAQCTLAYLIFKNDVLKKLKPQAIKYLEMSAKHGYMRAHDNIGFCYEKGFVYKRNFRKAFKHYFIASNSGVPYSHYNLGRCYQKGMGVELNFTLALVFYYKGLAVGDSRCLSKIKEIVASEAILEYTNLTRCA